LEMMWKEILSLHLVVKTEERREILQHCRYLGQDLKTRASTI
jgi:hypothetical protein